MSPRLTRRRFLSATAALAAGFGYLTCRAAAASKSINEKLNIGIIGAGGRGGDNLAEVAGENIVALCDVDDRQLAAALKKHPHAKAYHDFRRLIAEHRDLDAVVISTTDHTHAPAAVRAMRRGLHVYCEKPLAHTVAEARLMQETYLKHKDKIATQMGTQIHATDNYRRVVELVQSGAIGKITEAHVWCNRFSSQDPPPAGEKPAPEWLHWDLWIGPAPFRPYQDGYLPGNLTWNRYWDFGNGILGDMGSHLIDLPYWALELAYPVSCKADAPKPHPVIYPRRLTVTWDHPKRGDGPHQQPCKVIWYDGEAKPSALSGIDVSGYGIGVLFVGDGGKLLADYGRRTVFPAGAQLGPDTKPQENANPPRTWIAPSRGHHQEWLHACKNDPAATLCNFLYSGRLIEHNLLGAVSHRCGNKLLEYDHKILKAAGLPEADPFIRKPYRQGWDFGEA